MCVLDRKMPKKNPGFFNNRVVDAHALGRQGRGMKSLVSYYKIYTFLTSNEERRRASVVALKNTDAT